MMRSLVQKLRTATRKWSRQRLVRVETCSYKKENAKYQQSSTALCTEVEQVE